MATNIEDTPAYKAAKQAWKENDLSVLVVTVQVAVGALCDWTASEELTGPVAAGWRLVSATMSNSYLVAVFTRPA